MIRVALVRSPIAEAALHAEVADAGIGAVSAFVGTVRNHNAGRPVTGIEYTAYDGMATRELEAIAREAEAAHARFMQEVIWPVIRPEALALLKKHRDAGEQLLIITATNEFVTRPIADALGVDELIAVELVRDAEGWYSGEISGVPSLREGKVERLQQWLHQHGLDWDKVETTFYSDSSNDIPLLERVNHPVATNPDAKLKAVAIERGWPILELFPTT